MRAEIQHANTIKDAHGNSLSPVGEWIMGHRHTSRATMPAGATIARAVPCVSESAR